MTHGTPHAPGAGEHHFDVGQLTRVEGEGSLTLRIREEEFTGHRMMVVLCDRYGNEKKLVFGKGDFR